jgi:hypothetical protein
MMGDLGLVLTKQYILRIGLIKEKVFVQFEVSHRSSDVYKLFSVIRGGSSNIMYNELQTMRKNCKTAAIPSDAIESPPAP